MKGGDEMNKTIWIVIAVAIVALFILAIVGTNKSPVISFGPNETLINRTNQTGGGQTNQTNFTNIQISTKTNPNICSSFIRGDANNDKKIDNSDPIYISMYLKGTVKPTCTDAADINDDEWIDSQDVFGLSYFIYGNAPAPKSPYPTAGTDELCDKIDNDKDARVDEGCPQITNQTNQTGSLSVTSNPTSAYLYVDNVYRGLTPDTASSLTL